MKLTGAEILCEALIKEGVEVIFGFPGGVIMPVYDALLKYPKLRHILVRHEQGAAHAAEGYARATGKPGVCIVTSGPGATNLTTGIADAMMDSVPIICISGQVISPMLGTDAFQETDVVGITGMITKHNYLITKPEEIAGAIKESFYLATTGRPGPIMIDITKDAQVGPCEFNYNFKIDLPGYKPVLKANNNIIQKAAELINQSKQPLVLAGHGILISKSEKELQKLVEKANLPVATTLLGIGVLPKTHLCFVGMLGMHGNYSPNVLTNQADLLIAIGMRFDDRVTGRISHYAKKAKIIHIDIDPAELGKNISPDIAIVGDAKTVLNQLIPLVKNVRHDQWFRKFKELDKTEKEKITDKELNSKNDGIHMGEVIAALSEETKGLATVIADVGQNQMFTAKYYNYTKPNSFITSGGLGTMGFGLPAAMGVKIGKPHEEVWIVAGDGGFQMTIQELTTIVQENLAVKIIVMNNGYLGMVRQWQQLFFKRKYSGVKLHNPDFVAISKGFGINAERVEKRSDIIPAIRRSRAYPGPYLIEYKIENEANIFPIIPPGNAVDEIKLEE